MFTRQKNLCWIVLAVMFIAVASSGCGGGGGGTGDISQNENLPGWDSDPNPVANNQSNNNQNTNNGNTNQNQNQNPDTPTNPDTNNQNQNSNGGSDTPVAISGTWEIVSGSGFTTTTTSDGRTTTEHYTYIPGSIGAIGVKVSRNTWGGTYEGAYCVTLSGNDLITESTYDGTGNILLDCVYDEKPNQHAPMMIFSGGLAYDYIGNGTYQETDESFAKHSGNTQRFSDYEYTLKLEDSSTLRWTYWNNSGLSGILMNETRNEIVLKKIQ